MELGATLAPSQDRFRGERRGGENEFKLGLSAGATLRYGVLPFLDIQGELLYATRGTDIMLDGTSVGGFYFTYFELPLLARTAWRIPTLARDGRRSFLSLHAVAGPAISFLRGAERWDRASNEELKVSALSSPDVSVVLGLGLTWDIHPRLAASLEVRGDMGLVDAFPDGSTEARNLAILTNFSLHFALNDHDSDGVAGSRDRCADEGEYWNGVRDDDGCADDDPDSDGFVGKADRCPNEAEDENAYKDQDGCPDGHDDNDKDGIADKDDKCVAEAFPYNKDLDHDKRGCPPNFTRVSVGPNELELMPPLEFDDSDAQLTDHYQDTLNQVVVLLRDYYPDMQLIVEGHTTNKSSNLGKKRADAVKTYLVNAGIEGRRLHVETRGPERGGRTDRRVDLVIIEKAKPAVTPPPR